MGWGDFEIVLFNNLYNFLFCFLLIFSILFLVFRKNFFNLFDPLILMLINLSSCLTIILYLLIFEKRSNIKGLLIILITNILFLITLKIKIQKPNIKLGKRKNKKYFQIYYFIHTILFLITVILFIKIIGTKLITDKLTAFEGIGWLNYLRNFFFQSQLILIFIKRELYSIRKKIDYILILIIVLLYIFSGSKVGLVNVILLISLTLFYINNVSRSYLYIKIEKNTIKIITIGLLGIIIGFSLVSTTGIITRIVHRIMSAGDIYYMLYINDNIKRIAGVNMFDYYIVSIFRPFLKYFVKLKENIVLGFQAIEVVYNIQTKEFGPNARYDVIWEYNFGVVGILGGYLSATLFGFLRRVQTKNFYILNVLVILVINSEAIITDFTLFGSLLFSLLFCFVPLVILTEIISKGLEKNENNLYI